MKRLLFLCVLLQVFMFSNAQPFRSLSEARDYYATHISDLDPIEGLYDVENVVVASIPRYSPQRHVSNFTWAIWKEEIEGEEPQYIAESLAGDCKGVMAIIERIGETMIYKLMRTDANNKIHEERFELEDLFAFGYSYRNAFGNATGTVTLRALKKYPTRSMYEAAFKKATEEASLPQKWTGTGFALTNNYIVTNYHVVEDAKTISIQGINGNFNNKYNATVVAFDKFNDLALLRVNGVTITTENIPYSVKTTTSDVGEDVFVLGYPLTATMGDEVKLTTGVVSSKTGFQGDVSLYQISAPIQPGNSGGPLFDGHGNIIGIVSAKHRDAENVGYAIKASYLRNLMESAISTNILPKNNKISGMNLSGKVKAVKNYVYYITCSRSENVNSTSSSSSYSGISTSSSSTGQTFSSYPSVNRNLTNNITVVSVSLQDNQTVLTLSGNNRKKDGGFYSWVTLDKNAYIVANGQRYTLKRAEGIALSPDITYFSFAGETKNYTLYFPPIPKTTTSIDFIESADSGWKLYGIQLR